MKAAAAAAANQCMITIWNMLSNQTIFPQLIEYLHEKLSRQPHTNHHHVTGTLLMIIASNNPGFLINFEQSSCGNN